MRMMHTWLPMYLCLLILSTHMTQAVITCTAVTTIYETTVRCDFGTDIFQRRDNFNVQYYKPEDPNDPDTMLLCNWLVSGALDCKKGEGVTFNNVVSDKLTVKGPPSLNKIGEHYVCQLEAKANIPVQPCKLTFSDVTTSIPVAPHVIVTIPDERTDILWIILALTGVAVVGIFGFCIVYIIFNRHRARQSWHVRTSKHKNTSEGSRQTDEEVNVSQVTFTQTCPELPKGTEGSTECSGAEGPNPSDNTEPENKQNMNPGWWEDKEGSMDCSDAEGPSTSDNTEPENKQNKKRRFREEKAGSTECSGAEGPSTSGDTEPENKKPGFWTRVLNILMSKEKDSYGIALNSVESAESSETQTQQHRTERRGQVGASTPATVPEQKPLMDADTGYKKSLLHHHR